MEPSKSQSPTISFEAPPAAPLDFAIQPGPLPWGFTLTWQPGAGAPDGYAIIGTETYSNLGAPIGPVVVTEPSYSINLALPYTAERFAVQAMRGSLAGGTTQFLTAEVEAPASLYNLQGSQPCLYISDALENLDQTFVAPVGGALQVIELQDTRDGTASQPVYVDLLTGPASSTTVDMGIEDGVVTATSLSGTMVEGGLLVSAGETLTLRIPSSSYSLCATLDGPFDGGTLSSGGVVQDGLELVFAAWIEPESDLSAPALTASAETSAAYLSWSASPGATSYQLERGSDGGPLSALATTTETWALDTAVDPAGNYDYQVIAVGADGGSAASNVANIQLDGSQLAAAQVDGLEVIDLPPMQSVGQSFTVSVGGTLDFIEVPTLVSYGGAATLSLSDFERQPARERPATWPDLRERRPDSFELAARAGVLFLRRCRREALGGRGAAADADRRARRRLSDQLYARLLERRLRRRNHVLDGGAVPGQDLDFKVVVQ